MNDNESNITPPAVRKERKLTLKQRKFVHNYVQTGNGTQAAKDAGYSPDVAHTQASENLNKPAIKAEIDAILTPIYTPEFLQRKLTELLNKPDLAPGSLTRALELAMRNLAMLTERTINETTMHTSTDELITKAEAAIDRLKAITSDSKADIQIREIMLPSTMADTHNDMMHDNETETDKVQVQIDPTPSGNKVEATPGVDSE